MADVSASLGSSHAEVDVYDALEEDTGVGDVAEGRVWVSCSNFARLIPLHHDRLQSPLSTTVAASGVSIARLVAHSTSCDDYPNSSSLPHS